MNCNCECKMLNITAGTDITLAVTLRRDGKLFPVELSDSVKVNMVSQRGVRTSVSCRVGTGKVAIPLLGDDFAVGVYGVEITGVLNDAKWRTFCSSVVKYTYATERGAARVITDGDTYDIELEVGAMSDIVPHSLSELDSDPGHRTVTDAEKERWNQGGGKINIVKVDGEPLDIDPTDKSVDIDLSGKVDKEEGKGLSTNDYTTEEKTKLAGLENYDDTNLSGRVTAVEGLLNGHSVGKDVPADAQFTDTVYDDTQVRRYIQQLNTDINTQTGRINAAISELDAAKREKIAEMDAAKVATETATAAANTATQAANVATAATNAAIEQAERLNVELEGSVITVTDKDGNESEIDLLDATNERVYVNVTTNKEDQSVAGLVINCFLNNDVDEPLQATTNANGQCYFDVPNNYHYRLVFPTIAGCDPITDVTHIAHASERIIDVEYKETVIPPFPPVEGEHLTITAFKKIDHTTTPYVGLEIVVTIDGTAETYQINEEGYIMMIIPFGKTYRVEYPRLGDEGYYLLNNKYVYDCISEKFNRIINTTYNLCDSGVYIVDDTGTSYLPDDFFELVRNNQKTNDQALMIKVATSELIGNDGVFALDIDILRNRTFGTSNRSYCTQNILLETIPLNGNDITDDLYFKGYETSVLAYEEISRKLGSAASPLFSYIMPMTKIINGITLNGFVGSIGQWRVCQEVVDIIDGILVAVRPNGQYLLGQLSTSQKNTSTQSAQDGRWCWNTQPYSRAKNSANPPNLGIPFFTIF